MEKVDPRVNPNLLLEETSQEFWDNMSRKPYAKAILKSERHWSKRRTLDQDGSEVHQRICLITMASI